MTPERRRQLLAATPLGHWVAARFDWDESKVHRDHGRFAPSTGAGAEGGGEPAPGNWKPGDPFNPTADYGASRDRPSVTVYPGQLPADLVRRATAWKESLTPSEKGALGDYAADLYRPVNRSLRSVGGDPGKVTDDLTRVGDRYTPVEAVGLMMSALAKHPLSEPPLTCWRVMALTHDRMEAFTQAATAAAATGGTIRMPVFGSASLNPQFAVDSSAGTAPSNYLAVGTTADAKSQVLLEIRSRTGGMIGAAGISCMPSENEVLQPPTAQYRVLGWQDVKFGQTPRRVLRLEEVLPDPPGPPAARPAEARS